MSPTLLFWRWTLFLGAACLLVLPELAASQIVQRAQASIQPARRQTVQGTVTFTQVDGGVEVVAELEGLTPGQHGFHIHEKGDCNLPDFTTAGGHFNPHHEAHGGPDSAHRHVGDLGNIEADSTGKAHYKRVDTLIKLNGDDSIIGRALIIHAAPDDYTTQPTGNAGGRIGCGLIKPL